MDRAHRLGQKKVVNVHRLIMRGTLEEKVMSLQRFKISVANAVINAENSSMKTMNTDQLLDLFASAETSRKVSVSSCVVYDMTHVRAKYLVGYGFLSCQWPLIFSRFFIRELLYRSNQRITLTELAN